MNFFNKVLSLAFFIICIGLGLMSLYFSLNLENVGKEGELFAVIPGTTDCDVPGETYYEGGECPDGWTYGPGCSFHTSWEERHDEACADHQIDDPDPGTCDGCNCNLGRDNCDNLCSTDPGTPGLCSCKKVTGNACVYQWVDGSCTQTYTPGDEWFCSGDTSCSVGDTVSYGCLSGYYSDSGCDSTSGSSSVVECSFCNDCGGTPETYSCWDTGCTSGDTCEDGTICNASGQCVNPHCPTESSCSCPIPNAELSAACEPAVQPWESTLTNAGPIYGLTLSNIYPPENVSRATFALCFGHDPANATSDARHTAFVGYLGDPDSCQDDNGDGVCDPGWYCWNISYPSLTVGSNEINFLWDRAHTFANGKTISDLAYQTQLWIDDSANNDLSLTESFTYSLYSNLTAITGPGNDQITGNGLGLSILPNACAEEPIVYACDDLLINPDNIEKGVGDTMTFTCYGSGEDASYAWFRILDNNNNVIDQQNVSEFPIELDVDKKASLNYVINNNTSFGDYTVQCQICLDTDSLKTNCTPWGAAQVQ